MNAKMIILNIKKLFACLGAFIVCACITSCSVRKDGFRYSSAVGNWQSSERYIVKSSVENYMVYDKMTGEQFSLVRDPFAENSVDYVNVCGNSAYYIEHYGKDGSWKINEISLNDFSTKTIYERNNSESVFLGLSYKQENLNSFLNNSVLRCMVTNEYIFLETGLNGLTRIDRITGIENNVMRDMCSGKFYSNGEKIYYLTDEMLLKCYSIKTDEDKIITDSIFVSDICLMSDEMIVLREYGGKLYLLDVSDNNEPKYLGITANQFTADEQNIYFTTDEGVFKMKPNEHSILMCEGEFAVIDAMNDNKYLYFFRYDEGNAIKGIIDKDTFSVVISNTVSK